MNQRPSLARLFSILLLTASPAFSGSVGKSAPGAPAIPTVAASLGAPVLGRQPLVLPAVTLPGAVQGAPLSVPALPTAIVPTSIAPSAIQGAQTPLEAAQAPREDRGPSAIDQVSRAADASSKDGGEGRVSSIIDGSAAQADATAPLVVDASVGVEAAFQAAVPNHPGVQMLRMLGIPLKDFATETVMANVFMQVRDGQRNLEQMMGPLPGRPMMIDLAHKILDLVEREDAAGRRFAAALGRDMAARDVPETKASLDGGATLPPNPLEGGEYWDLAAGPNGIGHMLSPLDPKTQYVFFDRSAFVTSYLESARALAGGLGNVRVVKTDLRKLQKPSAPLSVIRWKNVHGYVEGFEKRLAELGGWLQPGGRFVIQTDPSAGQRVHFVEHMGPQILKLIEQGWTFDFEPLGHGGLETMTLTKPRGPPAGKDGVRASIARWRAYERAAEKANRAEMFGGFFFGR